MSELEDDILAMLGPLPELSGLELRESPGLWDGWAESVAQVEEVYRAYTEPMPGLWDGWAESVAQVEEVYRAYTEPSQPRRNTQEKTPKKYPESPPPGP